MPIYILPQRIRNSVRREMPMTSWRDKLAISHPSGTAMTEGSFRQAGSTLLSVMVSLGIGVLAVFLLFLSINGAILRLKIIVDAADRRELRLRLATKTDCVKAKAAIFLPLAT